MPRPSTFSLDIAYKLPGDYDKPLIDILGPSTSSGAGFGLRNMQWEGIPEGTLGPALLALVQKIIPDDYLAYVCMAEEPKKVHLCDGASATRVGQLLIDFQSSWYQGSKS